MRTLEVASDPMDSTSAADVLSSEGLSRGFRICMAVDCVLPGTELCSRCLAAVYCSRECQLAHYKTHKKACKAPLRITQSVLSEVATSGGGCASST